MERVLQSRLGTYLVAVAAVAIATAIRLALGPWLGDEYPFAFLYAAVAVAVWTGGYGPGILATVLAYVLASLLFLRPQLGTAEMLDAGQALVLASYLVDCGVIVGVGGFLKGAQVAAKYDRDFLDMALKAANMNTFNVDLDGGTARRSENAVPFYGLDTTSGARDAFLQHIHPDDKKRHLDAIRESRTSGKEFISRYRFIRPTDQRTMWVESHGRVIRDEAGKARLIGAAVDVTERVSLEQQVARHAEALDQASKRKSEFLSMLAHELRNPLAPIKTYISLMKRPQANEHSRELALQVIERQTGRMERLIEDLLDISRIEQGKVSLHLERVDIARIMEKAVEAAMPYVEEKSQRLSFQLADRPLLVHVDEARMVQVVNNLLNNSSKFTPAGGSISIHAVQDNDGAKIIVADDGIGIAPDELDAIFEAYFQSGRETGGTRPGLGLGLALCKAIVELHGGRIEARSEGPGKGSEFTISLPISTDLPTSAATR